MSFSITPRSLFSLQTAKWTYFSNGYTAEIILEDEIYNGYVNGEFVDATVDFVKICNLLITEIRNRESEFESRIGNR